MTTFGIDKRKLTELRAFVQLLDQKPEILQEPDFEFFREYLLKNGATLPPMTKSATNMRNGTADKNTTSTAADEEISADEADSADEQDEIMDNSTDTEIIPPELDPLPVPVKDEEVEFSEEQYETIAALKEKAAEAMEEKRYDEALKHTTEILLMGNPTALMYSKRADLFLRVGRPKACIHDCDCAIRLNPDNGKAYRIRGRAYRALGDWENAHRDLEIGQKIDYDDDVYEIQKYVAEKWKVLDEKRRAKQRRREERARRNLLRERRRRQAAARREYEAQKMNDSTDFNCDDDDEDDAEHGMPGGFPGGMPGGFPGGMPGGFPGGMGGGMPGGMGGGMPGGAAPGGGMGGAAGLGGLLGGLMGNPEMKKAMENPKVLQAVMELMQNPAAFSKYQNDPEVMSAFSSLMGSMKGSGAAPGGGCGAGAGCGTGGCAN